MKRARPKGWFQLRWKKWPLIQLFGADPCGSFVCCGINRRNVLLLRSDDDAARSGPAATSLRRVVSTVRLSYEATAENRESFITEWGTIAE